MSSNSHTENHVAPLRVYFGVYFLLLFLTIATVLVSYLGLPPVPSIMLAMTIASIKAFFVGAWFMHLLHDTKFNVLFFLASVWFIGVFFVFTTIDLSSRGKIMKSSDTFELRQELADQQSK